MNTFQFFKNKQEFKNYRKAWKAAVNSTRAKSQVKITEFLGESHPQRIPGWITSTHFVFNNIVNYKNPRRGFLSGCEYNFVQAYQKLKEICNTAACISDPDCKYLWLHGRFYVNDHFTTKYYASFNSVFKFLIPLNDSVTIRHLAELNQVLPDAYPMTEEYLFSQPVVFEQLDNIEPDVISANDLDVTIRTLTKLESLSKNYFSGSTKEISFSVSGSQDAELLIKNNTLNGYKRASNPGKIHLFKEMFTERLKPAQLFYKNEQLRSNIAKSTISEEARERVAWLINSINFTASERSSGSLKP